MRPLKFIPPFSFSCMAISIYLFLFSKLFDLPNKPIYGRTDQDRYQDENE